MTTDGNLALLTDGSGTAEYGYDEVNRTCYLLGRWEASMHAPPGVARSVALAVSRCLWFAGGVLGLVVTGISYLVAIPLLIVAAVAWSLGERALLRRRGIEARDAGVAQVTPAGLGLGLSAIVLACISVALARSDWRVAIVAVLWFAATGLDVLRARGDGSEQRWRRRPETE